MIRIIKYFLVLILVLNSTLAFSQEFNYTKKDYINNWCRLNNGAQNVVRKDKSTIDCVTKQYAVKVVYANDWARGIGESMDFAMSVSKAPAIVLIIEDYSKDYKDVVKMGILAKEYNLKVFTIRPQQIIY